MRLPGNQHYISLRDLRQREMLQCPKHVENVNDFHVARIYILEQSWKSRKLYIIIGFPKYKQSHVNQRLSTGDRSMHHAKNAGPNHCDRCSEIGASRNVRLECMILGLTVEVVVCERCIYISSISLASSMNSHAVRYW